MKELTIEEKQLLLKDLSARLPYGVKINSVPIEGYSEGFIGEMVFCLIKREQIGLLTEYGELVANLSCDIVKPYLRQMSSMTEEEMDKIEEILGDKCIFDFMGNGDVSLHQGNFTQNTLSKLYDFYNSIHVDYRGLISMGLAIEVTKENNPY